MTVDKTLDRHANCSVVILPRFHQGKPRLIPGLYCENHAKLIKWLNVNDSNELTELGVKQLKPMSSDQMSLIRQTLIAEQQQILKLKQ
jgi:hypothetical protein